MDKDQSSLKGRDLERFPSFREVDEDGNGAIEFEEFRRFLPDLPDEEARRIFEEADIDHDGTISRAEYIKMKTYDFARNWILPKNIVDKHREMSHKDQYNCLPPPIFMFVITAIEIMIFFYHTRRLLVLKNQIVDKYGPAPIDSKLIYHPERRHEVWRYFTYMFVHSGYMHIINNVVMQLILGILLEIVHKWWRVLLIYFSGVLAGSLATSVVTPSVFLAGASAGVYALIFAHMSTVILNWNEMRHPWIRVILFTAYVSYDVGIAWYFNYHLGVETYVSYPAHLGGGIAGFLIGIYVLKNLKWETWETYLWYGSLFVGFALIVFAIGWNLFKQDYYP